MDKQKKSSIVVNIISLIIILALLLTIYKLFNRYNFNEYVKSEYISHGSEFTRDTDVKYSNTNSYKIASQEYNDAMFYKKIKVTPNTPYKVTCMIKTEDVQTQEKISNGGAHICIADTTEKSKSVIGTNDWQKIEFMFDSKNREEVNIGFRLGGYDENCKGTAWFSEFTIESGIKNSDTEWKFALCILKNIDVNIESNGKTENIKLSMTSEDVTLMKENINRFNNSIRTISNYNMSAKSDIYQIDTPITSLSYDNENGYFVAPKDIEKIIDPYIKEGEYDHIFIAVRLGDIMEKKEIPVNDWIGLRVYGLLWNRIFKYKIA